MKVKNLAFGLSVVFMLVFVVSARAGKTTEEMLEELSGGDTELKADLESVLEKHKDNGLLPIPPEAEIGDTVDDLKKEIDKLKAGLKGSLEEIDALRTLVTSLGEDAADIVPVRPGRPGPLVVSLQKEIVKLNIFNRTTNQYDLDLTFVDSVGVTKTTRLHIPPGNSIIDVHTLKRCRQFITQLVQNQNAPAKAWRVTGSPPKVDIEIKETVRGVVNKAVVVLHPVVETP